VAVYTEKRPNIKRKLTMSMRTKKGIGEQNIRISKEAETRPHLRDSKDEYHCQLNICYDTTPTSKSTTEETSSIIETQDDDSESSLLVLIRYIGCGPPQQSSESKIDQKIGNISLSTFMTKMDPMEPI